MELQYREPHSPEFDILLLAARAKLSERERSMFAAKVRTLGVKRVLAVAEQNKVLHLVASVVRGVCGRACPADVGSLSDANRERVERLLDSLSEVVELLNAEGIKHAVIEGGATLLGSSMPLDAYCSGDLDVLVSPTRWQETRTLLESAGFIEKDRRGRPTKRIEYGREGSDGVVEWLEFGCEPFDRMWLPLPLTPDVSSWLQRACPSAKRPELYVLAPADAVALTAIHVSLHSFIRSPGLRLHVDVDRAVRSLDKGWDGAINEIISSGASLRSIVALVMVRDLLETPIPSHVLERLVKLPRRAQLVLQLLSRYGLFDDGDAKLPVPAALALDLFLDERGVLPWVDSVVFPEGAWMREHFDRNAKGWPTWALHLRRYANAISSWRPQ